MNKNENLTGALKTYNCCVYSYGNNFFIFSRKKSFFWGEKVWRVEVSECLKTSDTVMLYFYILNNIKLAFNILV